MTTDELRILSQRNGWAFPVQRCGTRVRIEPVSDVYAQILLNTWATEAIWLPRDKRRSDC